MLKYSSFVLIVKKCIRSDCSFAICACSVELGWVPFQSPWWHGQNTNVLKGQNKWALNHLCFI